MERAPGESKVLLALASLYDVRGMYEESLPLWKRLARLDPPNSSRRTTREAQEHATFQAARAVASLASLGEALDSRWRNLAELDAAVRRLLDTGRASAAARLLESAYPKESRPWEVTDRIATLRLHLGEPEKASTLWREGKAPRESLLQSRLGMASLAADDLEGAREHFLRATRAEPGLFEAWYGLTLAESALGHAAETVEAGRKAEPLTTTGAGPFGCAGGLPVGDSVRGIGATSFPIDRDVMHRRLGRGPSPWESWVTTQPTRWHYYV